MLKATCYIILKDKTSSAFLVLSLLSVASSSNYRAIDIKNKTEIKQMLNVTKSINENINGISLINRKIHEIPSALIGVTISGLQRDSQNIKKLSNLTNQINKKLENAKRNSTSFYYTDARRFNTFASPADLNDPNFQKFLDEYRGMVHKYGAPQEMAQPVGENQKPSHGSDSPTTTKFSLPQNFGMADLLQKKEQLERIYRLSRLTTQFVYSTSSATKWEQAIHQGLVKGHHPEWGKDIGRDSGERPADQSAFVGRKTTAAATRPPLPGETLSPGGMAYMPTLGLPGAPTGARFQTREQYTRRRRRTTPPRYSFDEHCDYHVYYCLKAYDTGRVCGRTMYSTYHSFVNYCMLDYVNCMERYEVWQLVHMGECFELKLLKEYVHYPYVDDDFLKQYDPLDV